MTYFLTHGWLDSTAIGTRNEKLGARVQVLHLVSLAESRLAKLANGVVLQTILGEMLLLVFFHVLDSAAPIALDHAKLAFFRMNQIVLEYSLPLAAVRLVAAIDFEVVYLFLKFVINDDFFSNDWRSARRAARRLPRKYNHIRL